MNECDPFEQCQKHWESIHRKLDRLDEAIRGNGKPGIQLRLDRLEAGEKSRAKLIWIIVGAAATLAMTALWQQVFGG